MIRPLGKITVLRGNKIYFWRSQKKEILVHTCKPQLILLNLVHCTPAISVFIILYILHRKMIVEVTDGVRVTLAWASDTWFLIFYILLHMDTCWFIKYFNIFSYFIVFEIYMKINALPLAYNSSPLDLSLI